jgi:muconolactone delta-isomerase
MESSWLRHIRADKVVAFPRDYGLWRKKLFTRQQYLTACRHAEKNMLELYTSIYSDHEVSNQLATELFYDIDLCIDESSYTNLNYRTNLYNIKLTDVTELIVQLEPIIKAVRTLYTGGRGIHLHIDLQPVQLSNLRYAAMYVAELLGIAELVDKQVLGDWRRVSRVPGSYHKSGNKCVLLNQATNQELEQLLSRLLHEKYGCKTLRYTVQLPRETSEVTYMLGEPPPCISFLFSQLTSGQPLSHGARLHLGAYLMKMGLEPEEASVLYSKLPDYNNTYTTYQLRWLQKHSYNMYSCVKAKQLGLCPLPLDGCKYYPSPNHFF